MKSKNLNELGELVQVLNDDEKRKIIGGTGIAIFVLAEDHAKQSIVFALYYKSTKKVLNLSAKDFSI